eukprot:gene14157-18744_t
MSQFVGSDNAALELLANLSISCETISHKAAFTVQEQEEVHKENPSLVSDGGLLTKNLFLRDKKHGLFLLTTAANQEVNMKEVASLLKLSGANLRLGDEDLLMEKLGVTRGSLSPFALLKDKENQEVKFCLDKTLMDAKSINIHPLRNDMTTNIKPSDLLVYLENVNHTAT